MPATDRLQFFPVRSKVIGRAYACSTEYYAVSRELSPGMVELAPPVVSPDAEGYNFLWR